MPAAATITTLLTVAAITTVRIVAGTIIEILDRAEVDNYARGYADRAAQPSPPNVTPLRRRPPATGG